MPLAVLAICYYRCPTACRRGSHYFAIFVAMIVGMILEPIPATAISFIAVTVSVLSANWVLFGAQELAEPGFKAGKEALKWRASQHHRLAGVRRLIFALGYEATGLGRRIALFPVKFMGKRTLTLGYAVVITISCWRRSRRQHRAHRRHGISGGAAAVRFLPNDPLHAASAVT